MRLRFVIIGVFVFLTLFVFKLTSLPQGGDYKKKDVQETMQKIFEQHLGSKSITPQIVQKSIVSYIDQFDPTRIYLIDDEVLHYYHLSNEELMQIIDEYNEKKYAIFHKLDQLFQHSIWRSREIRKKIESDRAYLVHQKVAKASEAGGAKFAQDEDELREKIQQNMVEFIQSKKKRFGEFYVIKHISKILDNFESEARIFENQYLYLTANGEQMNKEQTTSLFALHVLKAIAKSLDHYTDVLTPNEAYDMKIRLEKGYPGVGIVLQQRPKGVFISRIVEDGPAQRSGFVRVNDRVVSVDGVLVSDLSVSEVLDKLRGEVGTSVDLVLDRKVKDRYQFVEREVPVQLKREYLAVDEGRVLSSYDRIGNGIIGKVKLDSFYRGANGVSSQSDMLKAIQDLDCQGNLRGLVIDMRENTGGFLTEAVKVAGLFITNGVIVTAKYSNGNAAIFRDIDHEVAFDGPIVILTSKATASAAEIVAQALQDYGVAVVVGDEKTYGKGTIQNQTVTGDMGQAPYKVTIGKYYTVSGKTPNHTGVKADIVVPSQFVHAHLGNELIEFNGESIPSAFHDKLEDVPLSIKDWYLRFYIPTLQTKTLAWREMIPILKKNSAYRISKNKDYQFFLAQTDSIGSEETVPVEEEIDDALDNKNSGVEDLQMAEAVNIVKDMIILQQHMKGKRPSKVAVH